MIKALKQSIKALSANVGRTALTTLGIVIGIATVILVLSAGAGFRSLIDAQVAALGSNTLFVQTHVPSTTKSRAANSADFGGGVAGSVAITTLTQRDLDTIEQLPNVVNGYAMVTGQAVTSYRNTEKNIIYYGQSASKFDIDKNTLKEGRFYTQAEDTGAAQVIILGSQVATDLFGQDDPVGKLVHVGTLNFEVIGVYNSQGGLGGFADDSMYMPLGAAQKKMLGIDYLSTLVVQMKDTNLGDSTVEQIRILLRHNHNITDPAKDDFSVQTQAQALDTFNTILGGVTILLIAIAAISLVVGGVGIMNIMYVVVTERTAEIGLKKALGAKEGDILKEFLIESILVTLLGGVIGIIVGGGLSWVIALIANKNGLTWLFSVPLYSVILAVGVSSAIGILAGVLPARNASKLDPVEALRYE